MTSGDIDDTIGSQFQLTRYLETNDAFRSYMATADQLPILRATIPYGAGISTDGQTRYIDYRINTMFNDVDVALALATHESCEWGLREFLKVGLYYEIDPLGHRLANRAEFNKLIEVYAYPPQDEYITDLWEEYDDFIDPQIRRIEHSELDCNIPLDLALYPYEGTKLYDKIRKAQGL